MRRALRLPTARLLGALRGPGPCGPLPALAHLQGGLQDCVIAVQPAQPCRGPSWAAAALAPARLLATAPPADAGSLRQFR